MFLLLWDGKVVAAFAHRRIREKPPSGGVSVLRESVAIDRVLLQRSIDLMNVFSWQGAGMVEYKIDAATGQPYLMEINGRFWGSLQLAIDAGVDFPRLLVALATGERPDPVLSYRTGVRSRWLMGDLDQLLVRLRRSARELSLPPDVGGRGKALVEFVSAFGPRNRGEVFRLDDPMPGVREAIDWLRRR
jgi:predicted ATP-grasp superfamily ATP-dependent carboligase